MGRTLNSVIPVSILICLSLNSFSEGLFGFGSSKESEVKDRPAFRGIPHTKHCSKEPKFGHMTNIEVIPCEGENSCALVKGTNVTLKLEFVTYERNSRLEGRLGAVLDMSFWSPTFQFGAAEDLCHTPPITCPTEPNQVYSFERTFYVSKSYPQKKLDVSIWVTGDKGDVACVLVPVYITSTPPHKEKLELASESFSWF